jgi:hypothetical protein
MTAHISINYETLDWTVDTLECRLRMPVQDIFGDQREVQCSVLATGEERDALQRELLRMVRSIKSGDKNAFIWYRYTLSQTPEELVSEINRAIERLGDDETIEGIRETYYILTAILEHTQQRRQQAGLLHMEPVTMDMTLQSALGLWHGAKLPSTMDHGSKLPPHVHDENVKRRDRKAEEGRVVGKGERVEALRMQRLKERERLRAEREAKEAEKKAQPSDGMGKTERALRVQEELRMARIQEKERLRREREAEKQKPLKPVPQAGSGGLDMMSMMQMDLESLRLLRDMVDLVIQRKEKTM